MPESPYVHEGLAVVEKCPLNSVTFLPLVHLGNEKSVLQILTQKLDTTLPHIP